MSVTVPTWCISVKSALALGRGSSCKLCYHHCCCYYYYYCISGMFGESFTSLLFLTCILCFLPLWVPFEFVCLHLPIQDFYILIGLLFYVLEWYREMKKIWKCHLFCSVPKLRDFFRFSGRSTFPQPSMISKLPGMTTILHVFCLMCFMTMAYNACFYTHFCSK